MLFNFRGPIRLSMLPASLTNRGTADCRELKKRILANPKLKEKSMKDRIELFLAPGSCSPLAPGRRFQELRHAIAKRAYDMFASRGFTHGHDLRDWFLAETELVRPISIEMSETETELTVKASLPGFAEKDIDVRVEPRRLFITGERENK